MHPPSPQLLHYLLNWNEFNYLGCCVIQNEMSLNIEIIATLKIKLRLMTIKREANISMSKAIIFDMDGCYEKEIYGS